MEKMIKEVKEVKRIPDAESVKEACYNGKLQAIGKTITGWKVTIYADGTTDKEVIHYTVRAKDVLSKEEMTDFRKAIRSIVNYREGIEKLFTMFNISANSFVGVERYLDGLFRTPFESTNGTAIQTCKEDSVVSVLQMAERGVFETTRYVRRPKPEKKELTKEELDFIFG